jgi:SP family myo-inositol transporter-like MFS transporter 13
LADRIGRKWVLAIGDVLFVLGAIIICSSFSVIQIITGRVVLGFGVGIAAGVAPLCEYLHLKSKLSWVYVFFSRHR